MQEPRQGRAVTDMRRLGARNLCLVLAGLGQQDRVALLQDRRAGLFQRTEEPGRSEVRIQADCLARKLAESRLQLVQRAQAHLIAEVLTQGIGGFVGIDEEVGGAVLLQDGT